MIGSNDSKADRLSLRQEVHDKLDALLHSISSRQLDRLNLTSKDLANAQPMPESLAQPLSHPLPQNLVQSQTPQLQIPHPSRVPQGSRTSQYIDFLPDHVDAEPPAGQPPFFPPIEDFYEKIAELKQKNEAEDLLEKKNPNLGPYVDALLNYVHCLERERHGVGEEIAKLRRHNNVLVSENRKLHEEMKKGLLEEALHVEEKNSEEAMIAEEALHNAKAELAEMAKSHQLELKIVRDQLELAVTENERLIDKVSKAESEVAEMRQNVDSKLTGETDRVVKTLVSERNELSKTCLDLSTKLTEIRSRERELLDRVKKTVAVADQALHDKDEAVIRAEALEKQLGELGFQKEAESKRKDEDKQKERERLEREWSVRVNLLEEKAEADSKKVVEVSEQLRVSEGRRVAVEREVSRLKAAESFHQDDGDRALRAERVAAEQAKTTLALEDRLQAAEFKHQIETDRLRREIESHRTKATMLEAELGRVEGECLKLHQDMADLQREAGLHRLSKETVEKFRFDDLKDLRDASARREAELQSSLSTAKAVHEDDLIRLKGFSAKQAALITDLKSECVALSEQLEQVQLAFEASENSRIQEVDEATKTLKRREDELKKMKQKTKRQADSLKKLNKEHNILMETAQDQQGQLLDLNEALAKAVSDRQMKDKENDFLLAQINTFNPAGFCREWTASTPRGPTSKGEPMESPLNDKQNLSPVSHTNFNFPLDKT